VPLCTTQSFCRRIAAACVEACAPVRRGDVADQASRSLAVMNAVCQQEEPVLP